MINRVIWTGEHLGYDTAWIMIQSVTFTLHRNHMKMWFTYSNTTRWKLRPYEYLSRVLSEVRTAKGEKVEQRPQFKWRLLFIW